MTIKPSQPLAQHIDKLRLKIESKYDIQYMHTYATREGVNIKASINVKTPKGLLHFSKLGPDYYQAYSGVFKLALNELRKCKACKRRSLRRAFFEDDDMLVA